MLKHRLTVFCENAMQMADGRLFLGGVFPGQVLFPPPGPGALAVLDIMMQFGTDAVGKVNAEIRVTNTDGNPVAQFKNVMEFKEPVAVFTCTINKLVLPSVGPGVLRVHYRTDDTNWTECGDLLVLVHATPVPAPMQ